MPKYPVLDVAVREWTVRMHVNVLCWQFTETTGARLVARMRRVLRTRRAPDEDPQQSCCGSETFPQIAEAQSDASKEGMAERDFLWNEASVQRTEAWTAAEKWQRIHCNLCKKGR